MPKIDQYVTAIYHGSTKVNKVYFGATFIWPRVFVKLPTDENEQTINASIIGMINHMPATVALQIAATHPPADTGIPTDLATGVVAIMTLDAGGAAENFYPVVVNNGTWWVVGAGVPVTGSGGMGLDVDWGFLGVYTGPLPANQLEYAVPAQSVLLHWADGVWVSRQGMGANLKPAQSTWKLPPGMTLADLHYMSITNI